jgi:hypothetical protein
MIYDAQALIPSRPSTEQTKRLAHIPGASGPTNGRWAGLAASYAPRALYRCKNAVSSPLACGFMK